MNVNSGMKKTTMTEMITNKMKTSKNRDIPVEFQIMVTTYVANINKEDVGYIYDWLYSHVWMPHDAE